MEKLHSPYKDDGLYQNKIVKILYTLEGKNQILLSLVSKSQFLNKKENPDLPGLDFIYFCSQTTVLSLVADNSFLY